MTATLDDVVGALADLTRALGPALSPATRPTWEQQRWQPDADAFGPDAVAVPMATALPPNVVANQLIESAWGNAVADNMKLYNEVRPFASISTSAATAAPSTNTQIAFTNPANVVNPDNVLNVAGSILSIPAKWPGLWLVTATFKWGSHGSAKSCAGWIDRGGARYGLTQINANITDGVTVATSAVIPCLAGAAVGFYGFQLNSSAVTVGLDITCTWLGKSPV